MDLHVMLGAGSGPSIACGGVHMQNSSYQTLLTCKLGLWLLKLRVPCLRRSDLHNYNGAYIVQYNVPRLDL